MKRLPFLFVATFGLTIAATFLFRQNRDKMFLSRITSGRELEGLLGSAAASWLEKSEIVSWSTDFNRKPERYLLVTTMSLQDFKAWASVIGLIVSSEVNVPPGIWIPIDGAKPSRWVETLPGGAPFFEGSAEMRAATVWSRWSDGTTYTVVQRVVSPP